MRDLLRVSVLLGALMWFGACDSDSAPAPQPDTVADTVAAADTGSDTGSGSDTVAATDTGSVSDTDSAADTAPDVEAAEPIRREVCGQAPYEWLPSDQVGQVVSFEPARVLYRLLPAELLEEVAAQAGYENIEPQYDSYNFELRYTTQDRGELVEATAMIGVPVNVPGDGPLPIAVWLHGTTGMVDDCAPSADDMMGPAFSAIMASFGYLSVAPDFIGLRGFGEPSPEGSVHPYLVGEPAAISSWDAVRAALVAVVENREADDRPDLRPGDPQKVVLIGGSQGGHAAFFTDRLAPYYAPEFQLLGVAAAVPPSNLLSLAEYSANNWGDSARSLPTVLEAMRRWYGGPDNTSVLADVEPFNVASTVFDWMRSDCHFEMKLSGMDELTDMYQPDYLAAASVADWDEVQPWGCYLAENSVAFHSLPHISDTPFITSYGENDALLITEDQRADYVRLCDMGYRLQYLECAGLGHTDGGIMSVPFLVDWLQDRVDGVPIDEADLCTVLPAVDCTDI